MPMRNWSWLALSFRLRTLRPRRAGSASPKLLRRPLIRYHQCACASVPPLFLIPPSRFVQADTRQRRRRKTTQSTSKATTAAGGKATTAAAGKAAGKAPTPAAAGRATPSTQATQVTAPSSQVRHFLVFFLRSLFIRACSLTGRRSAAERCSGLPDARAVGTRARRRGQLWRCAARAARGPFLPRHAAAGERR